MIRTALLLATLLPLVGFAKEEASAVPSAEDLEKATFAIEDARCYVGIAAVKLSVGEMRFADGNLVGNYTIRVPLNNAKNDEGEIVLTLDTSMEELGEKGGILYGKAISKCPDTPPHKVVCEVRPYEDAAVLLAITTPNRTISFESRYEVILNAANDG